MVYIKMKNNKYAQHICIIINILKSFFLNFVSVFYLIIPSYVLFLRTEGCEELNFKYFNRFIIQSLCVEFSTYFIYH